MDIKVAESVRLDPPEFFSPAFTPNGETPETQRWWPGSGGRPPSGEVFDVRSPIDGSLIARTAKASADDVDAAIAAARDARESFRSLPAAARLEADMLWEETFGPVLAVTRVPDLETALDISNRSRYGLDSAVFTSDLENAWRAVRALECGQVTINDAPAHGVGHFPFGGRKPDSGIGREGLGYSIDECTVLKTVVLPV